MLVLAVEREQRAAELAQVGRRGAAAAEVGARAALGADAAGEHELLGVLGQPVAERVAQRVGQREHALDVGLRRAGAHDPGARLAAEQQVERVREHGLARAGLAGEHVQAGPEAQLGPLDQQEVLDAQLVQHAAGCTSGSRRTGPPSRAELLQRFVTVSARGGRTARAGGGRSSRPAAGRACRGCARTRRAGPRRAAARSVGRPSTWTSTGSSRDALLIVSTSPGATTSARAVSECGAMNETTKPSTPQASTGPPLARL